MSSVLCEGRNNMTKRLAQTALTSHRQSLVRPTTVFPLFVSGPQIFHHILPQYFTIYPTVTTTTHQNKSFTKGPTDRTQFSQKYSKLRTFDMCVKAPRPLATSTCVQYVQFPLTIFHEQKYTVKSLMAFGNPRP